MFISNKKLAEIIFFHFWSNPKKRGTALIIPFEIYYIVKQKAKYAQNDSIKIQKQKKNDNGDFPNKEDREPACPFIKPVAQSLEIWNGFPLLLLCIFLREIVVNSLNVSFRRLG